MSLKLREDGVLQMTAAEWAVYDPEKDDYVYITDTGECYICPEKSVSYVFQTAWFDSLNELDAVATDQNILFVDNDHQFDLYIYTGGVWEILGKIKFDDIKAKTVNCIQIFRNFKFFETDIEFVNKV